MMCTIRRITKLQVFIDKGVTILTYDDDTKRRIDHEPQGFKFDCNREVETLQLPLKVNFMLNLHKLQLEIDEKVEGKTKFNDNPAIEAIEYSQEMQESSHSNDENTLLAEMEEEGNENLLAETEHKSVPKKLQEIFDEYFCQIEENSTEDGSSEAVGSDLLGQNIVILKETEISPSSALIPCKQASTTAEKSNLIKFVENRSNQSHHTNDKQERLASEHAAALEFYTKKIFSILRTTTTANGVAFIKSLTPDLIACIGDFTEIGTITMPQYSIENFNAENRPCQGHWHLRSCMVKADVMPRCNCHQVKEKLIFLKTQLHHFIYSSQNCTIDNIQKSFKNFFKTIYSLQHGVEELYELLIGHTMMNEKFEQYMIKGKADKLQMNAAHVPPNRVELEIAPNYE